MLMFTFDKTPVLCDLSCRCMGMRMDLQAVPDGHQEAQYVSCGGCVHCIVQTDAGLMACMRLFCHVTQLELSDTQWLYCNIL